MGSTKGGRPNNAVTGGNLTDQIGRCWCLKGSAQEREIYVRLGGWKALPVLKKPTVS
jgi:hypothetical protein